MSFLALARGNPLTRLVLWLEGVLLRRQTIMLEALLGLQALTMAWWVSAGELMPGVHLWDAEWPQLLVGLGLAVYGSVHLFALKRADMPLAKHAVTLGSGLWMLLLVNYLMAAPTCAAVPMYAANTAASWWIYARLELLT